MPYVVKHSSGRSPYWIAVYRDETGRRRKRSTKQTNKAKAREIAFTLERAASEARRGALTEARTRELLSEVLRSVNGEGLRTFTVAQWFDHFVNLKRKSRAGKTALRHAQVMNEFVRFLGYRANLNIATVTSKDVADFRDRRESFGLSPATLNGDIAVLSAAFNAVLRQGHISVNPCAAIEPLKDRCVHKSVFTPEQVTAILRAIDCMQFAAPRGGRLDEVANQALRRDWKGLVLTAFYSGLRLSDASNLQFKHVDVLSEIKTIRLAQRKTGAEIVIAIHPVLEDYFLSLPAPNTDEAYLFPSLAQRNISPLSKAFKKIMDAACIEQSVIRGNSRRKVFALSFHSLRHSFTSLLANAGVSEETRMALTGHTTREMQQRYTHRELTLLRDAVDLLPHVSVK
jgi:integrase